MIKILKSLFLVIISFVIFSVVSADKAEALICDSDSTKQGVYCDADFNYSWCGNNEFTCQLEQTYGAYSTVANGATFVAGDCGACQPTCKNGQIACKNNQSANAWDSLAACQASVAGQSCNYADGDGDASDGRKNACGSCYTCNTPSYNDCRDTFGADRGCVAPGELTSCVAGDPNCTAGSCNTGYTLDTNCGVCTAVSVTPVYLDYHTVPQYGDVSLVGEIGIGLADPGYQLHVSNSSGVAIINVDDGSALGNLWTGYRIERSNAEKWFIGLNDSSSSLLFRRNGATDDLAIDSSGKVIIAGQICLTDDTNCISDWTQGGGGESLWVAATDYIHSGGEAIALGTAAAPVDFGGLTNNLLYGNVNNAGAGSNLIKMAYDGADRFIVDTFGNGYFSGNLSVQIDSAAYPFYVADDGSTAIVNIDDRNLNRLWTGTRLARSGAEKWFIGMGNLNDNLLFQKDGGDVLMYLDYADSSVNIDNLNVSNNFSVAGRSLYPTEIRETTAAHNANFDGYGGGANGWEGLKNYANTNGCSAASGWHVCQSWEIPYLYSEGGFTSNCDYITTYTKYDGPGICTGWLSSVVSETSVEAIINEVYGHYPVGDCNGFTNSENIKLHSSIWLLGSQWGYAQCSDNLPVLCCR